MSNPSFQDNVTPKGLRVSYRIYYNEKDQDENPGCIIHVSIIVSPQVERVGFVVTDARNITAFLKDKEDLASVQLEVEKTGYCHGRCRTGSEYSIVTGDGNHLFQSVPEIVLGIVEYVTLWDRGYAKGPLRISGPFRMSEAWCSKHRYIDHLERSLNKQFAKKRSNRGRESDPKRARDTAHRMKDEDAKKISSYWHKELEIVETELRILGERSAAWDEAVSSLSQTYDDSVEIERVVLRDEHDALMRKWARVQGLVEQYHT